MESLSGGFENFRLSVRIFTYTRKAWANKLCSFAEEASLVSPHPLKRTSFLLVIKKIGTEQVFYCVSLLVCLFDKHAPPKHTRTALCGCSCAVRWSQQCPAPWARRPWWPAGLRHRRPGQAWRWSGRLCWPPVFICQLSAHLSLLLEDPGILMRGNVV